MHKNATNRTGPSEVTILARVLANGQGLLPRHIARYLLTLGFGEDDKARMHELAVRNQDGMLAPSEKDELSAYSNAGSLLSILKSECAAFFALNSKSILPLELLMDAALVRQVWLRAGHFCEYCRMHQDYDDAVFEIDHIIARKHGGPTVAANLALSCFSCNSSKGSDIGGLDRGTRKLTPLFNPRRHKWSRHFHWRGAYLIGATAIGRVTIALLNINDTFRVRLREGLIREGIFPPA